jgi:hypothetical protein
MALSAHLGKSIQMRYSEHDRWSVEKNPACALASLINQSLAVYVELEKTHWHLRLNSTGYAANLDFEDTAEIAREASTISLRLIASISRLQRVLNPNFRPECAALLTAINEKIAENCELAIGSECDLPEHIAALVFRGPSRFYRAFRDTKPSENTKTF